MEAFKSDHDIKEAVEALDLHLGRIAMNNMKNYSHRTNQINMTTGFTETQGSLRLRSIRLAQELTNRGIGLGDVVMICGMNSDDIAVPVIASMFLGSAVMPLPVNMVYAELKHMVLMGKPKIVFSDIEIASEFENLIKELDLEVPVIVLGKTPSEEFTSIDMLLTSTGREEEFEVIDFEPTTTAFIIGSSGTTGLPKGICVSHKGLVINLLLRTRIGNMWEGPEVGALYGPTLFWLSGTYGLLLAFSVGCVRLYTPLPITTEMVFDFIKRFKPQMVLFTPVTVTGILNHPDVNTFDFSCIRTFTCIGSALPYEKLVTLQKRMPNGKVSNMYGMTETSGVVCVPSESLPNCNGKCVPWVKFKVVHPETNQELGPRETGELCLKSDYVLFTNYFNNPEATAAAFDEDKWFHTGDVFYYDEQKNLYFVDRLKEMFKYHNYQIAPSELEGVIRGLAGVQDVCVMGIHQSDDDYLPRAFVQLVPGSKVTAEDIMNIVKENLSDYNQFREGIIFVEKLPLTRSGKIDRKSVNKKELKISGL